MMVNALAASDRILIPVQTEFLAMKGLERMVRTLAIMQKSRSREFKVTIVPTMYDKRTRASLQTLNQLKRTIQTKFGPLQYRLIPNFVMPVYSDSPLRILQREPWRFRL